MNAWSSLALSPVVSFGSELRIRTLDVRLVSRCHRLRVDVAHASPVCR